MTLISARFPVSNSFDCRYTGPMCLLVVLCMLPLTGMGAEQSFERFFGIYAGSGQMRQSGDAASPPAERNLAVEIVPSEKGFTVSWTTVTVRKDGKKKSKHYSIPFVRTHRESLYASAMRVNMFGKAVPLDPIKGEPYVWATIVDDTMTVHLMEITEDFGYEMQVYERTLTEGGMHVRFFRVRDGEKHRTVEANLIKVPG